MYPLSASRPDVVLGYRIDLKRNKVYRYAMTTADARRADVI
jgi:hypothetical protein